MNIKKVSRVALMACLLLAGAAKATTLELPNINPLSATTYNNFNVYSLDLLNKCAANPACQPSGPLPVASGPGQIADQTIILTAANGVNVNNFPSPFTAGSAVDDSFDTSTSSSGSFTMTDAGGAFAGDLANRWDINLGLLKTYLGGNDLVFLFDNNQSANGGAQFISIWGQARIYDNLGNVVSCFEISTSAANSGCHGGDNPTPATSDYLNVISDFCVDKNTGESYNLGGAHNAGDCPVDGTHTAGGYQVNNNLSTSQAEFAAYNKALSDAAKTSANNYTLSVNIKYIGQGAGAEQLWICSACDVNDETTRVPEPGTPFLIGISLLGLAVARRLPKRNA